MKQIHVYELTNEEIKSIDKIMREERKIGFELKRIFTTQHPDKWINIHPYSAVFEVKEKAEKKNVK